MLNFFLYAFFLAVFVIFYSYVLFPLLLSVLASKRVFLHDRFMSSEQYPSVSIVISAFNEERVIAEKIEGILQSNYPKEKLEILIGSDASVDQTADIIQTFVKKEERIHFYNFKERRGKPSVINELLSYAKNPIVVLTDANVMFEKETLAYLCRHFKTANVGLVGSNILNIGMKKDGISIQEKSYIERENKIKYQEGLIWGTMMGPFGGCYAIRKKLYEPVPSNFLVDDFFISMKILEKGFLCINELEAVCYEDVSNDVKQEYKRKARVSAGNFQNLSVFSRFVTRPFTPAGFCFISHKVLRWLTPFFILLSLISLIILALNTQQNFFIVLLIGEIFLLLSPALDRLFGYVGMHFKLLRFVSYFSLMNLALLQGFIRFSGGIKNSIWTPTKRNV